MNVDDAREPSKCRLKIYNERIYAQMFLHESDKDCIGKENEFL